MFSPTVDFAIAFALVPNMDGLQFSITESLKLWHQTDVDIIVMFEIEGSIRAHERHQGGTAVARVFL